MTREHDVRSDLIDLGSATAETKGPGGIFADDVLKQPVPGISND